MRPDKLQLEVVTPEQAVLAEEVDEVDLPGELGQVGVLPGHVPTLTKLGIGEMVVYQDGDEDHYFIVRGFAEILGDRVRVLAQECEGVDEIDVEKAREQLKEARQEVDRLERERTGEDSEEDELLQNFRESQQKARRRLMVSGELDDE
jgi:F-type H+-transporting ATPase subunit epsilon